MKKDDNKDLLEQYNTIMKGYEPRPFLYGTWTMENGVYKQYSAYDNDGFSVGGTSFCL